MATINEVKSALAAKLSKYKIQTPTRVAYLGDGRGNATSNMVPVGEPNKFWARESLDGDKPFKIINKNPNVTPAFNLPVLLGYPEEDPTEEQVLGLHTALIKINAGGNISGSSIGGAPPHHQKHEWGGGDTVYVDPRMFKPGLVAPTSPVSMRVKVLSFQHYYNNWRRYDGGVSPDLTQYIPDSDYRYALLCLDPDTNQLVIHPGSVFSPDLSIDSIISNAAQNTFRHIPVPPGDEIPLAAILLEPNTTKVNWNPEGVNNLMPMRLLLSTPLKQINERLSLVESRTGLGTLPQTGSAQSPDDDLLPGRIDGNRTRVVLNRSSLSGNLPTLLVGELGYVNNNPSAIIVGTASGNKQLVLSGGGGGASVLDELEDVEIGTLNFNNVLAWDYGASIWKPTSSLSVPRLRVDLENGGNPIIVDGDGTLIITETGPLIIDDGTDSYVRFGGEDGEERLVEFDPIQDGAKIIFYNQDNIGLEIDTNDDYIRFPVANSASALFVDYNEKKIRIDNDTGLSPLVTFDVSDNRVIFGSDTSLLEDGNFEIHSPSNLRLNSVGHFNHYPETLNRATTYEYYFKNESGSLIQYFNQAFATVSTSYGTYGFTGLSAGVLRSSLFGIDTSVGEVFVNSAGLELDFRAESNANSNMFKVDAKENAVQIGTSVAGQIADFRDHLIEFNKNKNATTFSLWGTHTEPLIYTDITNNRVGIGTNSPSGARLDVSGGIKATGITLDSGTTVVAYNVSNNNGDNPVNFNWEFPNLSTALGRVRLFRSTNTTGNLEFVIYRGDNTATVDHYFLAGGGYVVGNATGGNKGVGTINAAGDIYKNNSAFTNPDYVLEKYYTGKIEKYINNPGAKEYTGTLSIPELDKYMEKHNHLPERPSGALGIFERSDWLQEKVEEQAIYIVELHKRIERLEKLIGKENE